MLLDSLFTRNDIIGTAMQASALRNDVILNNIANGDTPGFKKQAVFFEDALDEALNASGLSQAPDLAEVKPVVRTVHDNFSYRLDGNNVDMEMEMTDLYKNSVRYDTMASCVISNYKRINMVLTTR